MPNRIIKESICTSEEIDSLSPLEEIFFYRLMVNCDDYGCMDARPRILGSRLFPLKKISEVFVISALNKLQSEGLIELYKVGNRPYLHMVSWENHQQIRAHKHKYPFVDDENAQMISVDSIGYQMQSFDITDNQKWDDINCNQMISDDIRCVPKSNPIQSESNPNPNPLLAQSDDKFTNELDLIDEEVRIEKKESKPKKKKEEPIDETPVVFQLLLNDNTMYDVHQSLINELKDLYPNVNIEQEFRNMIGWIKGNPTKKKTRTGIMKFINSWLAKEQNKSGNNQPRYGATGVQLSQQRDNSLDSIF